MQPKVWCCCMVLYKLLIHLFSLTSIWEEEGCNMVSMSCKEHDEFTANSQFITHLMGRILGTQGLSATPIDTKGFQNVLKLGETTNADSFDLFFWPDSR